MNTDRKDTQSPTQKTTEVDERNLVSTHEDLSGLDFDERVWLFWQRNKGFIIVVVVFVLAAVLGTGIFDWMRQQKIASTQEAYLEAVKNDTLSLFAIDHANSPLAGITLLAEADAAYQQGNFEKAAQDYPKAAESLKNNPAGTRARIGYGMTLFKQGNIPSARNALTLVSSDESLNDASRAEAHYLLAEMALTLNEPENALKHLDAIQTLTYAGNWNMRAEMLRMNAPELNRKEAETVTQIVE